MLLRLRPHGTFAKAETPSSRKFSRFSHDAEASTREAIAEKVEAALDADDRVFGAFTWGSLERAQEMSAQVFTPGGYRYAKGVFQYSAGVAALPGYRIVRVRFRAPVPLAEGFERAAEIVRASARPLTAFCACELRSPAPFTESGFADFNRVYVGTLQRWNIYDGKTNPVARSNVCPATDPPGEPSFHAFSYTEAIPTAEPSFVIAGSGEAPEGRNNYRDHIVRPGDVSPAGLREKARFVLDEMERRMATLGFGWRDATATQVYTIHDIHSFLADEIVRRGAARNGLIWNYCRPPVVDLEYEMDCRSVTVERVVGQSDERC